MIKVDKQKQVIKFANDILSGSLDYSNGVLIKDFTHKGLGRKTNIDRELFLLNIYNKEYSSKDFDLVDIATAQDNKQEMVSILLVRDVDCLKVKVHFIVEHKETISILYQVFDSYKLGDPYNADFRIPLLAGIEVNGDDDLFYCPGQPVSTPDGREVLKPVREYHYASDIRLPLVVCDSKNEFGFSIAFPTLSDLNDAGSTQNNNKLLSLFKTKEEFVNHRLHINPDPSFNDTFELRISGINNGWVEAFDKYRECWASDYDFSEYEKEDLKWFNECAVHNFTFLFGSEGYNHDQEKIDVEKLLKQGEEFGGYDTVTIWNQYPRLGIDSRTQWDFYDDFPGGREAIREAADELHKNNIYLFLPYIPWDQGMNESTNSMGDEFARIVKDTDADGYQLDTLHDIPLSFRKKLDAVRPGIVLTSQFHPIKNLPLEIITTSWNEFWNFNPMPEVDILRFICPIHIAPVISRWFRHEDKDLLIKRVVFNGAPIVIWQDIFGRWLPFSDTQKAKIKQWKKIYLQYREIYQGMKPIPLYPTYTESLYCNIFQMDRTSKQIYSFYNDNEDAVYLESLGLLGENKSKATLILGDGSVEIANNSISLEVPGKEIMHVLVE